jgi:hypothetical protein
MADIRKQIEDIVPEIETPRWYITSVIAGIYGINVTLADLGATQNRIIEDTLTSSVGFLTKEMIYIIALLVFILELYYLVIDDEDK